MSTLLIFVFGASKASAQIACPVLFPIPICGFAGIYGVFKPECYEGALVTVYVPFKITLLFPDVPVTPIVPVGKLWGPITGASTKGNFILGLGQCTNPVTNVVTPVLGTLIQIGTSAVPTPWYQPLP